MIYRAEIDGLRAIAIIPVILFHAGFGSFSGGYVGVDVFFVISGYLITNIIIDEKQKGTFTLKNFYERRIRRIIPALFFMIILITPLMWLLLPPNELNDFLLSVPAVVLSVSNVFFWQSSGYFTSISEQTPLLHTWSLGVEEQFYLLFPVAILLLWSRRKKLLPVSLFIVMMLSFISSEILFRSHPSANFYLATTRFWELLAGVMCAFYIFKQEKDSSNNLLSLIGVILIMCAVFFFTEDTAYPSSNTLLPVLGACLIIIYSGQTIVARVLSIKSIVLIGSASYAAYLWHQPIFALQKSLIFEPRVEHFALSFAILIVMTVVSYKFIEKPFRKINPAINSIYIFKVFGLASILIIMSSLILILTIDNKHYKNVDMSTVIYGGAGYKNNEKIPALTGSVTQKKLFLYGDSHARQYLSAIVPLVKEYNVNFESITHSACISLPNITNNYNGKTRDSCVKLLSSLYEQIDKRSVEVVVAYRWDKKLLNLNGETIDGTNFPSNSKLVLKALLNSLKIFIDSLGQDSTIILVGNVPTTNLLEIGGYIKCKKKINMTCPTYFAEEKGEFYAINFKLKELAEQYPNVKFINPYETLCKNGMCFVLDEKKSLYSDHAHLSNIGAEKVINHFEKDIFNSYLP